MFRFYFHLLSSDSVHSDNEGLEFQDAETAYLEAHQTAREMAIEIAAAGGDPYDYRFTIVGEHGVDAMELPFNEVLPVRAPLAFAMTDPAGRFLDVDETFCAVLALSRAELLTKDVLAVTAEAHRMPNKAKLEGLLATGRTFHIRKRYRRGDGDSIWVENQVSLFRDGLGPSRVVAGCRVLSPTETGWEAHDKALGLAQPATREASAAGQVQAKVRLRTLQHLDRRLRSPDC